MKIKKGLFFLLLCLSVLLVFTVSANASDALVADEGTTALVGGGEATTLEASYPLIFVNYSTSDDSIAYGDVGYLKFNIYPAYVNERYNVKVYNSNGYAVASVSSTYYNTSTASRSLSISVDTDDLDLVPGTYKAEYWLDYYTYGSWRSAPNKYTYYFEVTGNGNTNTDTDTDTNGSGEEHFTSVLKGTQKAVNNNFKTPLSAWKTTTATLQRTSSKTPVPYSVQLVEMYTGSTAAAIVEGENMFNANPSSSQQWVLMKFRIQNNGNIAVKASDIIFSSYFYSSNGEKVKAADTAAFSGQRKGMGVHDVKIYAGSSGYAWYGMLLPKSVGCPYLQISNGAGNVSWLDTDPEFKSIVCSTPSVKASTDAATGKIKLSWKAVPNASKYYIYRSTSKNGTYKYYKSTTKTYYTDGSTTPGTTYYYKVKAICGANSDGNSAQSAKVSAVRDCARPSVKISTVASSGKIKLTWGKVTGAKKYEIYRSTSKNGSYKYYDSTTSTSYTNGSTTPGKTYYYKVKAICGKSSYGNSALSEYKSITRDCARPVVTITRNGSGDPKLSWKKVTGATKYEIYRSTSKNGTYKYYSSTSKTTYTNSSVTAGKTYYYKVKAICGKSSYGNSAYSTVKSITAK